MLSKYNPNKSFVPGNDYLAGKGKSKATKEMMRLEKRSGKAKVRRQLRAILNGAMDPENFEPVILGGKYYD